MPYRLRNAPAESELAGWPALMELGAATGRSGAIDFLTEEVLTRVPNERATALRQVSLLDDVDTEMMRAVTDFGGSLRDLVSGLPLVDLHDDRVRLHDLLRDALRREVTACVADAVRRAAADELLRRGQIAAAATAMRDANDIDGIGRVAERLIDDFHYDHPVAERRAAVSGVEQVLGDDARAVALGALTAAITDPRTAGERLDRAVEVAAQAGRHDLEALAHLRLAEIAYSSGDVARVEREVDELVRLEASGVAVAARVAFLARSYLLRVSGKTEQVPPLVDALIDDSALDDEMLAVALFYRTVSIAYIGRIREARSEVDRLAPTLPAGLFLNRLAGMMSIQEWWLGEQSFERLAVPKNLVDRIEEVGQMQLFVEGAATVAIMYASLGDVETATDLVQRADRSLAPLGNRAWSTHTVAQAHAVLDLLAGDEDAARQRLDDAMPDVGPLHALPSHVYFLTGAMSYALLPRTRQAWDDEPDSPDLTLRTAVGRALVAFRDDGDTAPAAALPWGAPELIRPRRGIDSQHTATVAFATPRKRRARPRRVDPPRRCRSTCSVRCACGETAWTRPTRSRGARRGHVNCCITSCISAR